MKKLYSEGTVRIQPIYTGKQWAKATAKRQIRPKSYEVETEDGKMLIQNRRHLIQTKETKTVNERQQHKEIINNKPTKEVKTPSGRVVKTPRYLSDYDTAYVCIHEK